MKRMNNFATQRPDGQPPNLVQILQAALQQEQAAWSFYTAAVAAYGGQPPLQMLLDSCIERITALGNLCLQYGIPRPALRAPTPEPLTTGWRESLERAMQGTISSLGIYQQLIALTAAPAARRQLERLQTELLTRNLPALQKAWQAAVDRERLHAAQGIDPSQAHVSHGIVGDTMEALFGLLTRQGGVLGLAGTVLRAAHPMLLAGAAIGSLAVQGGRHAHTLRHSLASHTSDSPSAQEDCCPPSPHAPAASEQATWHCSQDQEN